jgi:hypothetical protein
VPTIDEGRYSFPTNIENSFLTSEQKRQYEVDGFFVVKGVVPAADLERYATRSFFICHLLFTALLRPSFANLSLLV